MKGSEFYGKGNQSPAKKSRGLFGYGKKVEQKHKDKSQEIADAQAKGRLPAQGGGSGGSAPYHEPGWETKQRARSLAGKGPRTLTGLVDTMRGSSFAMDEAAGDELRLDQAKAKGHI